jgi:phospholipid transport system transporter-binding protein
VKLHNGRLALEGALNQVTLTKDFWPSLSPEQMNLLLQQKHCIFDFADVNAVDSAGLAWTLNAVRDGAGNGVEITLCNLPEKMVKLARISELDGLLPISSSES